MTTKGEELAMRRAADLLRRRRMERDAMVTISEESTEDVEDLKVRVSALEERDYADLRDYVDKKFGAMEQEIDDLQVNVAVAEGGILNLEDQRDNVVRCEEHGAINCHTCWTEGLPPYEGLDASGLSKRDAARILALLHDMSPGPDPHAVRCCPICSSTREDRCHKDDCELGACIALLKKEA